MSIDNDNCIEYKVEIRTLNKEIIEQIDFKNKINDMVNIVIQKTGLHIELEEMARINYPNPTPPSIMNKENVGHIPVVSKDRQLVGLITRSSLLSVLSEQFLEMEVSILG